MTDNVTVDDLKLALRVARASHVADLEKLQEVRRERLLLLQEVAQKELALKFAHAALEAAGLSPMAPDLEAP